MPPRRRAIALIAALLVALVGIALAPASQAAATATATAGGQAAPQAPHAPKAPDAPTAPAAKPQPAKNGPVGSIPHYGGVHAAVDTTQNVVYYGGANLENGSTVWAVYWEPSGNVQANYNTLNSQFLNDVGSSPLFGVTSEYPDSSLLTYSGNRLGGTWVDTSPYPANPMLDTDIQSEIARAASVNGWPTSYNNMYVVFTERGEDICWSSTHSQCASNDFCGYHGALNQYTYIVDPYGPSFGCFLSGPNANDADTSIGVNNSLLFDTGTDPTGATWHSTTGGNIGNRCGNTFAPRDAVGGNQILNGHEYYVSEIWDNYTATCQPGASSTVLPGTWPICAPENVTCTASPSHQVVAWGAHGAFGYLSLSGQSVGCNTGTLGDPNKNTMKMCYRQNDPTYANTWVQCAAENALCVFNGSMMTVAYGANGHFSYRTGTNTINCNNGTFGDPAPNVVKACYVMAPPPGTVVWHQCASEGQQCYFTPQGTHEIAYGANGHYFYENVTATPVSGFLCSAQSFGDPAPGFAKNCYWASGLL